MKIKYFVYILLVLVFGYLIYNRISQDAKKEKNTKGDSSKSSGSSSVISAIIIQPEKFYNNITVSGTIEPNEQVKLRSEISGLVREINFAEGTTVQKGAVLIKIDDRELKAQLEQALTKENLASEVEDRASKLLKSEAISQEEYDNSLAELKSLKAQTQLIRAQLSKTEIRAPFSGKIGLRSVSAGAYITPTSDIANLVSVNPVKLNFSIPEKYARRVKAGTHLSFSVAGNSRLFTATIYAIEPAIDINTRTLLLRAKAENESGELLPGTFANIQLPLETINDAILVPSEAIVPVLKGKQVYKVENGRTKAVDVYTDIRTDKEVLITSGLHKGDTVLISGLMSMAPDQEVKVKIVQKNQ
ncbi:efflux RND transporter periplasmic adaptor subunit [Pseudopedobacter beijingensis]|uniref:Efflux RND transporter periplasmic adaptor subunit n=1 Tax=Pseudopedobacter beijingensis TaxID=1207056 RepID=A0ABW4IAT5_9SPHI